MYLVCTCVVLYPCLYCVYCVLCTRRVFVCPCIPELVFRHSCGALQNRPLTPICSASHNAHYCHIARVSSRFTQCTLPHLFSITQSTLPHFPQDSHSAHCHSLLKVHTVHNCHTTTFVRLHTVHIPWASEDAHYHNHAFIKFHLWQMSKSLGP